MVQHLVSLTYTLLIMPTVTDIHTQILALPTLFQVEYKTHKQSWLELTGSHLMTGKCFILLKFNTLHYDVNIQRKLFQVTQLQTDGIRAIHLTNKTPLEGSWYPVSLSFFLE